MNPLKFANKCGPFSLAELGDISGAKIISKDTPPSSFIIHDVVSLFEARENDLSVLHQKKYVKELVRSLAGACIVAPAYVTYAPQSMHLLVHKNPYKAFALILQAFYPFEKNEAYIADNACISKSANIGSSCRIEHGAYIGKNVVIGDRCKIGVNTYIGDGVAIGDDCQIESNVSISNTIMGNNVLVYPGARIGQDGFGFASDEHGHYKIPHRGRVLIGNDVAIGANTCIDRGSLKDTVIGDWCRIDNLVQIGHNVKIGKGSIIAAQAALAGSTEVGEFVSLGGQVGIASHSKIGNRAILAAKTGVMKDIQAGAIMGGCPAVPIRDWHKQTITLRRMVERDKGSSNK